MINLTVVEYPSGSGIIKLDRNMARIFIVVVLSSVLMPRASGTCNRIDNQAGTSYDCAHLYYDVFPSDLPTDVVGVDFSYNSLGRVPNQIKRLPELRQLNLSNNRIHDPVQNGIFENNLELLILDLSGNKISSFLPDALVGLARLEVLDIHNNLIVSIPAEVFWPLPPAVTMCIGDNHWRCDCDLYHALVERHRNASASSMTCRGAEPECTSPVALYGTLFSRIPSAEELCGPEEEQSSSTVLLPTTAMTTDVISLDGASSTFSGTTHTLDSTTPNQLLATSDDGMYGMYVTPRDLPVVGKKDGDGLFLTQEIVTYGVIVVGGMVLIIFLLLTVLFSRMVSKRRCASSDIDSDEESGDFAAVAPWPLLQSSRQLPPIVPGESDPMVPGGGYPPSGSSDYQEIPAKFLEGDYRDYRGVGNAEARAEESLDGVTGKAMYMTSIGSTRERMPTPSRKPNGTDAYMPMHAAIPIHGPMRPADLYAPCETQN